MRSTEAHNRLAIGLPDLPRRRGRRAWPRRNQADRRIDRLEDKHWIRVDQGPPSLPNHAPRGAPETPRAADHHARQFKALLGSPTSVRLAATVRPVLALIVSLGAAPCRDEGRDGSGANRSPEAFINGLIFTLKGVTSGS